MQRGRNLQEVTERKLLMLLRKQILQQQQQEEETAELGSILLAATSMLEQFAKENTKEITLQSW